MSKLELIQSLSYEEIKKGRDQQGVPYLKYLYELHKELFFKTCSSCPGKINSYIRNIKNYKSKTMSKKENKTPKFALKEGAVCKLNSGKLISQHNLSDYFAIQILSENENRKVLFSKLPNDWASRVKKYLEKNPKKTDEDQNKNQNSDNSDQEQQQIDERRKELDELHYTKLQSILEGYEEEYTDKDNAIDLIISHEFAKKEE